MQGDKASSPAAARLTVWTGFALAGIAGVAGLLLAVLASGLEWRAAGAVTAALALLALAWSRWNADTREVALGRELQRLRDLSRASNDWHWETDADLRFTYLSPRFEEATGCPRERIIGLGRGELADSANNPEAIAPHLADLRAHRPFRDFVYHHDGVGAADIWVSASGVPMFDEDGKFTGYRGTSTDVTDRCRAEEEAARIQAQLTQLTDNVPGAVYQCFRDPDGHMAFTFVSAGIVDLYGLSPAEVLEDPTRVFEAVHPDDFARVRQSIRDAYNRAAPWFCEYRIVLDGQVKWVRGQSQPQPVASVEVPGRVVWSGLLTDVTKVKEQERELVRARERAELANKSKAEFLATMSHELRTPLNAVIGFAEVLEGELMGPLGDRRYQGYAADIRESGQHLLDLINDILDFAKIEAGRRELHEEWLSVPDTVRGTLRLVKERAASRGVALQVEVPDELPRLYADQRALKQILINLLSNAVKFTDSGGTVTIAAGSDASALCVTVADTGIGIAEADIARVMAPFGQVDNALTRQHEGTGLGLALVRQLTELHGGTLQLDSEPGTGTTVRVRLPAERLARTANLHPPAPRTAAG